MAEETNVVLEGVHDQKSAIEQAETLKIAKIDLRQYAAQFKRFGVCPTSATTYIVRSEIYTAAALAEEAPHPPAFIIGGLLPVGLLIFAAPSKFGKSWACIDMCAAVAQGRQFWGLPTQQCAVLYLDLESSKARLYDRMQRLNAGAPANMYIIHSIADLDHGMLDELALVLDEHQQIKLIVIDTIGRVMGASKRGEDAYRADTRIYGKLQKLAQERQIAIVCVTHTRKDVNIDAYDDPFTAMQGSAGVMGVSDNAWMIVGKRDSEEKRFLAAGRDIDKQDYTIKFNKENCKWTFVGATEAIENARAMEEWENNPIRRTIKKLLGNVAYVVVEPQQFYDALLEEIPADTLIPETESRLIKDALAINARLRRSDKISIERTTPRKTKSGQSKRLIKITKLCP